MSRSVQGRRDARDARVRPPVVEGDADAADPRHLEPEVLDVAGRARGDGPPSGGEYLIKQTVGPRRQDRLPESGAYQGRATAHAGRDLKWPVAPSKQLVHVEDVVSVQHPEVHGFARLVAELLQERQNRFPQPASMGGARAEDKHVAAEAERVTATLQSSPREELADDPVRARLWQATS